VVELFVLSEEICGSNEEDVGMYCAAAYSYEFFWIRYPGQIMDDSSKQITDTPKSTPKPSNYISLIYAVLIYIYILQLQPQ
jgi:hypothetical protein